MNHKVGDKICVHGYWGTILEIQVVPGADPGRTKTRFKVHFDDCDISNTSYDDAWYGCYTEHVDEVYAFKEV